MASARWWTSIGMLLGCRSAAAPVAPAPHEPAPPVAVADAGVVADADVVAAIDAPVGAAPAKPPYRDFVTPPPLVLAAPVKASTTCLDAPEPAEGARVVAALDAELRKTGGFVLRPTIYAGPQRGREQPPRGSIVRGRDGERLMIVGGLGCGMPMPTFAIDGTGAVFIPEPTITAKSTRTVLSCQMPCGGCGANMPPRPIVAEVPAGAHPDPATVRYVKVTMDVHVAFSYPKTARCMPKP